ncbi:MAG: DNA methyltransferase [Gammaproteobacteria bacterium]
MEYRPAEQLRPADRNARTHSPKQIRQIAASIRRFGFTNPILTNGNGQVISGHGRLAAAAELGLTQVPTLRLDHLTPTEQRAYVLADNRLAELAGWDRQLLGLELLDLSRLELDFDLTITGFDTGDIDVLVDELEIAANEDDLVPALAEGPAVSRPGDLWQVGTHRLLCGDATDSQAYARLLGSETAQLVFIDPPYNVAIQGHVSGLGKVQHREFAMASGEMSAPAFTAFLQTVFTRLVAVSDDGAIHFVCMDWRHMGEVLTAGTAYRELKNLCVWTKTNGGMGSLYRSQHELVFVFKAGTGPHINNVELGVHGRYRTNVWAYAGMNTFSRDRNDELALHPTVKPVALVADAIQDCSHRGGLVLDVFAGSGTSLLAAHKTGRRGYGMELDARYCDVILRRLREATGFEAVLADDGQSFDTIQQLRSAAVKGA